jgi:hypothetical protein
MNRRGVGRKLSWLNFKVLSRYLPGRTEENQEKPDGIASLRAEI